MQSLDTSGTENLIQCLNLVRQLMANGQEAIRKLRNVDQSILEVLSQIIMLILVLQSVDHQSDDSWLFHVVHLINDLFFAIQVDGAAHDDERGVQCIIVLVGVVFVKEPACALDYFVFNALLLACMVDTHVAEHAKAKLT